MSDRELDLQARLRLGDVAHLEMARIDLERDLLDITEADVVAALQIANRLDGRVREVASGVILEEVGLDLEGRGRIGAYRARRELGHLRIGKALRALDRI